MKVRIHYHLEANGRWFAEVREFEGAVAYGLTKAEARAAVLAVAREVAIAQTADRESAAAGVAFATA